MKEWLIYMYMYVARSLPQLMAQLQELGRERLG